MKLNCLCCGYESDANEYALEVDEVYHYCINCNNCKAHYYITAQRYLDGTVKLK